jgi:hypothetical protein
MMLYILDQRRVPALAWPGWQKTDSNVLAVKLRTMYWPDCGSRAAYMFMCGQMGAGHSMVPAEGCSGQLEYNYADMYCLYGAHQIFTILHWLSTCMSLILGLKEENEMIWKTGFGVKRRGREDEGGWGTLHKGRQRLMRGRVKGDGGNQRNKESDGGET